MPLITSFPDPTPLRETLRRKTLASEREVMADLCDVAAFSDETRKAVEARAAGLVEGVRADDTGASGLDAFLQEYQLSNREGVVLMCLAEALLRIPDADTANRLIRDKLGDADWGSHLGKSSSLFVNASTWALMLTGKVIEPAALSDVDAPSFLRNLVKASGEPVIRGALMQAMKIMGRQFVMGRTINDALDRAREDEARGYLHSYDMLGEAARTMADADAYLDAYSNAIEAVGRASQGRGPIRSPGVSVKLSALHPRYELLQRDRVMAELLPRIRDLARKAAKWDIGLCIDAEEADRLDLSLDIIEALALDAETQAWQGLGLAVQAYQRRAYWLLDCLADLARRSGRRLMVRLVKGAYWDTEIKHAQETGLESFPVFTRKVHSDVSYLACARKMFANRDAFYPQFATHNAHSISAILEMAGEAGAGGLSDFEFQRLHGMGESLYDQIVSGDAEDSVSCRIYAPVGSHKELLAYLVRRLLENGANTSFVNRIADKDLSVAGLVADPVEKARGWALAPHRRIKAPEALFDGRRNSKGLDVGNPSALTALAHEMGRFSTLEWAAGQGLSGREVAIHAPRDAGERVGTAVFADAEAVSTAVGRATAAALGWDKTPADDRAACLERAADLLELRTPEALALCTREAGKTLADGIAEVREAVDFCRYYATRARADFAEAMVMPGPTGETNHVSLHGRGVFACISPWNFPLAIFLGQVTAALAAGNAVVAKPADQTPLVAAFAVGLLHEAGVPEGVLQLLPGDGATTGAALVSDPRIAGVAFTGSTATAQAINRTLAARTGPIVPLIAETGGQNAMIVDSTALPEQVVEDAVFSAFRSAGQRCSALRLLYLQEDVADGMIEMLAGATDMLAVGDPGNAATDVGPVIDHAARDTLLAHVSRMEAIGRRIARAPLDSGLQESGTYVTPQAFEIDDPSILEREVFGPILHIIRYAAADLDRVIDQVNATGYGLTFGVQTRVESTAQYVLSRLRCGNAYVNRNTIGAVVGVQPFGGEGLSGTGPKAGGPRYLHRFAVERTVTVNTAAAGGNTDLMALSDSR